MNGNDESKPLTNHASAESDKLSEPKVGCCCGRTKMCACMTATQWIYCNLACSAITLLLGGLLWVIMSPVLFSVSTNLIFVTSTDSLLYESFACTWLEDAKLPPVPYYENFYLYNLTNANDCLEGALPIVEEHGPWVYRTNLTRYNIQFVDDDASIDYIYSKAFIFQPDMSGDNREDDLITVLNPGFLGALYEAGNERLLIIILVGPAINQLVANIESMYINGTLIPQLGQDEVLGRCREIDPTCTTTRDMAIVQWGFANDTFIGLNNQRMSDVFPSEFPYQVEYGSFDTIINDNGESILISGYNQLLFGTSGIVVDPANYELFAFAVVEQDEGQLQDVWGLSLDQANRFLRYANEMYPTYSFSLYMDTIARGGGLYATKTAYEWLWTATDPLLEILFPTSPYVCFIGNSTSPDDIYASHWRMGTGKFEPSTVFNVTMYENQTAMDWYENSMVEVTGNSGAGTFTPTRASSTGTVPALLPNILVWSPDHAGDIDFFDSGIVEELEGIPTHRYDLDNNATYSVNPSRDRNDPKFTGFVNATKKDMVPLYMSQPHFLDCNDYWRTRVLGVIEANYTRDHTSFNYEPLTGLGLRSYLQLQANFYLAENNTYFNTREPPRDDPFFFYYDSPYSNVAGDVMYPAFYVQQVSQVTPELAQIVQLSLTASDVITGLWIALMVIGSVALVGNLIRLIINKKQRQSQMYYTPINSA